jgi:ABC-type lipoprotein export system ATPase subunit
MPMKEVLGNSHIWQQNIQIQAGSCNQIVAPSGTGKTSLIHFLYGIRSDFEGVIEFDSTSIQSFSVKQWSQYRTQKISIVFQGLRLFAELDVMENIQIKNKRTNYKTVSQIHQLLDAVGMMPHIHKKAGILSYGQQQRVAIVRALCQPFELLLLDEPFSHLDNMNAQAAFECIYNEVQLQQATIVLTALQLVSLNSSMHVYSL